MWTSFIIRELHQWLFHHRLVFFDNRFLLIANKNPYMHFSHAIDTNVTNSLFPNKTDLNKMYTNTSAMVVASYLP